MRIAGLGLLIFAVMGLVYGGISFIATTALTARNIEGLWGSVIWLIGGLILLKFSRRFGERLGKGLE